jgi:hypothetical protein
MTALQAYRNAHILLTKTPHALADGLMLVFQHPVTSRNDPFQILGTLGTIGTALMYKSH